MNELGLYTDVLGKHTSEANRSTARVVWAGNERRREIVKSCVGSNACRIVSEISQARQRVEQHRYDKLRFVIAETGEDGIG